MVTNQGKWVFLDPIDGRHASPRAQSGLGDPTVCSTQGISRVESHIHNPTLGNHPYLTADPVIMGIRG